MNLLFYFDCLINHPEYNELIVNSTKSTLLLNEKNTKILASRYGDIFDLRSDIQNFCHSQKLRLDPHTPSVGSFFMYKNIHFRWHTVIDPIGAHGPLFSVRKHSFHNIDISGFISDIDQLCRLDLSVPILISGPTASGKTTFLNAFINKFLDERRLFILDSTQELMSDNPYWFNLGEGQKRIGQREHIPLSVAFEESLRLTPDRYVFGELRKNEGESYYRSLFTGHGGSIATLHCDNIDLVNNRLAMLCNVSLDELRYIFRLLNPIVFILKRPPNRLRGVYQFKNNNWEELFFGTSKDCFEE